MSDIRKYMDIVEQYETLDEIKVIKELNLPINYAQSFIGGQFISSETFGDIYKHEFPNYQQDVYYVGDKSSVFSYTVIENRSGYFWLMEIFTEPKYRGKGLGSKLVEWITKKLGKILIDRELSPESINRIEKLIASGSVNASIADIKSGTANTYNPDSQNDKSQPMYDQPIKGVNRPLLSPEDAYRFTWILESGYPRRGVLSSYTKYI